MMYTWMDIRSREEDRRERLLVSRGVSGSGTPGDRKSSPRKIRRRKAESSGAVRIRLGLSLIRLGRRLAFSEAPGEEPRSA